MNNAYIHIYKCILSVSDSILPKVLVQLILMKDCKKPGYNLMNLRTLISQLHGWPNETWDSDDIFSEMLRQFKGNLLCEQDVHNDN